MEAIIKELEDYLINFLEKPNPVFSNLPVCPFAKKARVEGKIHYLVKNVDGPIKQDIIDFREQDFYEILWIIDSRRDFAFDYLELLNFNIKQEFKDLVVFSGHPQHPFQINGLYTRREPFPNLLIQKASLLKDKEAMLKRTKYYSNFDYKLLD